MKFLTAFLFCMSLCSATLGQSFESLSEALDDNAARLSLQERYDELVADIAVAKTDKDKLKRLSKIVDDSGFGDVGKALRILALQMAAKLGFDNPKPLDFFGEDGAAYEAYNQAIAGKYLNAPSKFKSRSKQVQERRERLATIQSALEAKRQQARAEAEAEAIEAAKARAAVKQAANP